MEQKVDFTEFPAITKQAWIDKAIKDLKGKPFMDLMWQLEEGIQIAPFYHLEDIEDKPAPISFNKEDNNWSIGVRIPVGEDVAVANQRALSALEGGVNALFFDLNKWPIKSEAIQLLEGIELSFIETYLNFNDTIKAIEVLEKTSIFKHNGGFIF